MIEVRAATEAGWAAVEPLFGGPGDPGTCFCQWFRLPNREFREAAPAALCGDLRRQVGGGPPGPGVVALRDGDPVGWCGVAPLAGFRRVTEGRSPMRPHLGGGGGWAVTCFVVPKAHRGQGLTHALLDGAIGHARAGGAETLEGYPIDTDARVKVPAADLYHGPLSLFLAHGFAEVARAGAARPVVRLAL